MRVVKEQRLGCEGALFQVTSSLSASADDVTGLLHVCVGGLFATRLPCSAADFWSEGGEIPGATDSR